MNYETLMLVLVVVVSLIALFWQWRAGHWKKQGRGDLEYIAAYLDDAKEISYRDGFSAPASGLLTDIRESLEKYDS